MSPADVSVVVLAGGKGTRLFPLTAILPKPLVPLGDRPVLEILLRRLAASGFRKVQMCTGHLAELIMAVFGDGESLGLEIRYTREKEPLGTAGPLTLLKALSDPVLVVNGDLLTTLDFARLLEFHGAQKAHATISLFPRDVCIDFGVIECDPRGDFAAYVEKPRFHYEVSMGINVLGREALKLLEPGQRRDLPDLISTCHARGLKVACYREKCAWLDIGRMEDYAQAQELFASQAHDYLPAPGPGA